MNVILVEEDADFGSATRDYLEKNGFACELYSSPSKAVFAASSKNFDAMMIGLNVLTEAERNLLIFIRNARLGNKILLTYHPGKAITPAKLSALDMISLAKPYDPETMLAHLGLVLKQQKLSTDGTMIFNDLMIDVPGRVVRVRNQVISVTHREFDLLLLFVNNRQKVLAKHEIARLFTNRPQPGETDFGFLYAHIKNLRKKIKSAGGENYIKTVSGIGYQFGL